MRSCFSIALMVSLTGGPSLQNKVTDEIATAERENLLGIVAYSKSKTRDAERHFADAVAIYKRKSNDFSLFRTLFNLSHTYADLGFFGDAELVLRNCLAHYKDKKQEEKKCIAILQNLGYLYRYSGDPIRADEYYRQAIKILDGSDARESRQMGYALWLTGCNHLEAREPEKARKVFAKALTFDPNLKRTIDEQEGLLLSAEGKHMKAKVVLQEAIRNTDPKEKGFEYANYKEAMSVVLLDSREFVEAKNCLKECVRIRKELFGTNHPIIAQGLEKLAEVYAKEGNPCNAERLRGEAREMRRLSWQRQRKDFLKTIFGPEG